MRDPQPGPEPDDLAVRLAWPGAAVRWTPLADDGAPAPPNGNGAAGSVDQSAAIARLSAQVRRLRLMVTVVLLAWILAAGAAAAALLAAR